MSIFGKSKGNFLAEISIYPCGPESHLRNTPPHNGIRWNFIYDEDNERDQEKAVQNMIWPEFLDENGMVIDPKVPLIGTYQARMHIFPHMVETHFKRLRVGTIFYCTEGHMRTAKGTVIKLSI